MTRRLGTHLFVEDPTVPRDQAGRRYCTCHLHEAHERHSLPATSDETHAAEQRRIGERGDT